MKWRRLANWAKAAMIAGVAVPVVGTGYAFLGQETYLAGGSVQFQRQLGPAEIQQINGFAKGAGVHVQVDSNLVIVAFQTTSGAPLEAEEKVDSVIKQLPRRQLAAIEWGRAALKPIAPNRPLCIAISFLLGMSCLAVGVVLAAYARDHRTGPPKLPR